MEKNIKYFNSEKMLPLVGLVAVQMVLAYEWGSAGWGKMSSSKFVNGIAETFGYFASQNPYLWYKNFLLGFTTSNATLFAYLVEWAQVIIAITLVIAGLAYLYSEKIAIKKIALKLSALALVGGMLMNANFYFAAGWTSPSTSGINLIMFFVQAILVYIWLYRVVHYESEIL
ncbi:hypothetical protein A2818_01935 [Candidatus Nomurabacteria bacterium RIFCSPHIGHO2_01_FULL_40_12]|uniref:Uncharacterized protein n=1 Tax=Candidatus Nomurabacteria bacterium RIFCSPHIGHO2_01_FULL_40_12 TaxID=1801737 RepID=A0A1F6V1R1_9BACT|nr:MAG: hypothetical protein A2818_01935 [Candidatus Nomurabacteria bacterium RIFCSPHIGHO2_01_FULL_40_12]